MNLCKQDRLNAFRSLKYKIIHIYIIQIFFNIIIFRKTEYLNID